jgi:hypothetical protein
MKIAKEVEQLYKQRDEIHDKLRKLIETKLVEMISRFKASKFNMDRLEEVPSRLKADSVIYLGRLPGAVYQLHYHPSNPDMSVITYHNVLTEHGIVTTKESFTVELLLENHADYTNKEIEQGLVLDKEMEQIMRLVHENEEVPHFVMSEIRYNKIVNGLEQ